ncbi:MAG: DUF4861 family protein [Prolixibacteraceae bacterium]|nr:DUF4861 family protein [Prolixibacteraceae bacterium]
MKKILNSLPYTLVFFILWGCSSEKAINLSVKFNDKVSSGRLVEFNNIQDNNSLKDIIHQPFTVKQGDKEIQSQLFKCPVSGEISLLLYPEPDNNNKIKLMVGKEPATTFKPMAHAELWKKTGGEWVDRKYIGGEFIEVDSVRLPDECTDHSFYLKYEGPGWESNLVGYRFYLDWRNANDVFGKKTEDMVLEQVGQDGYDSYHNMSDWGMDNLKVGKSLGIGSIGYWNGSAAERVAETDSVISKIISKGPLRAMIQTDYYGWKTNDFKSSCTSYLSIDANTRLTRQILFMEEEVANICTGIHKDTTCEVIKIAEGEWTAMGTWGKQSLNNDMLGLVVIAQSKDIIDFTTDPDNQVMILKPDNKFVSWYFGATWESEKYAIKTIDEFKEYILKELELLNNPDKVKF